jgi:peptide/nickel transport system substrate-binding protein
LLAATACDPSAVLTKQGPQRGGTFTEAIVGSVSSSLNPLYATEDNSREIDSLVYRGLTGVGSDEQVVGDLARSFAISGDQLTWTFKLRTDVRWADGRPFGPDDVLFTYHLMQDPAYDQPAAQYWKQVQVQLAAVDEVRFVLKAPDASFGFALRLGIIPQHVFRDVPAGQVAGDVHSGERAFGTGPFLVASVSANQRVVTLRRNPVARPQPNLDQVVFRGYPTLADAVDAVSRGEADAVGSLQIPQLGALAAKAALGVRELKTFSFAAALFNLSPDLSAYFNPPAVRQAIVQAVDRRQLVKEVLDGRADAAPGPIPPTLWAYSAQAAGKYPYDPVQAAKTLDQAGWVLPPGGKVRQRQGRDFSISLVTADTFPFPQAAASVSRQLAAVGVQVTVDTVPASVLVSQYLFGKHYQMALVAFDNGPDPDQFGLWHSSDASDPLNFASVLTPKQALIDKDLEDGRATTNRGSRRSAYEDFQDLMSDAAPAIFLYEPHYAYVVSHRVHGVRTSAVIEPVDRFQYVTEWWVDVKRG